MRSKCIPKTMRFTGQIAKDKQAKYHNYDYDEVKFGGMSAFLTRTQFEFLFRLALHRVKGEPLVLPPSKKTIMTVCHLRKRFKHFGFPDHLIRNGMNGRWTLGVEPKHIKFDKSILRVTLDDELFNLMEEIL